MNRKCFLVSLFACCLGLATPVTAQAPGRLRNGRTAAGNGHTKAGRSTASMQMNARVRRAVTG